MGTAKTIWLDVRNPMLLTVLFVICVMLFGWVSGGLIKQVTVDLSGNLIEDDEAKVRKLRSLQ